MFITINLTKENETKTKIDIGIATIIVSIGDSYEIKLKFAHILVDEITKSFEFILIRNSEELKTVSQNEESRTTNF